MYQQVTSWFNYGKSQGTLQCPQQGQHTPSSPLVRKCQCCSMLINTHSVTITVVGSCLLVSMYRKI